MQISDIGSLLSKCSEYPVLYNKVSVLLYKNFNLRGAELTLICTYIVIMIIKNYQEFVQEVKGND